MKAGILVFPGTNCDRDLGDALANNLNFKIDYLWYADGFELTHDIYFLPGGFSYGDYLRSGAMASLARAMTSLKEAATKGHPIIGICNGFQVMTESHMLPGALIRNKNLNHVCKWTRLKGAGILKKKLHKDFALPISHSEGNYLCSDDSYAELQDNEQVLLRYENNPNGSRADIAAIISKNKKLVGLMPHPERAITANLDSPFQEASYGLAFFKELFSHLNL